MEQQRAYVIRYEAGTLDATVQLIKKIVGDRSVRRILQFDGRHDGAGWLSIELTEKEAVSVSEHGLRLMLDRSGVRLYDFVY